MFRLKWTATAARQFEELREQAARVGMGRAKKGKAKPSKVEGLYKQVAKCIALLRENPRHPGLNTHAYLSLENPYGPAGKVFEAYAQHRTPNAYRVFWCYGPAKGDITILAITGHP